MLYQTLFFRCLSYSKYHSLHYIAALDSEVSYYRSLLHIWLSCNTFPWVFVLGIGSLIHKIIGEWERANLVITTGRIILSDAATHTVINVECDSERMKVYHSYCTVSLIVWETDRMRPIFGEQVSVMRIYMIQFAKSEKHVWKHWVCSPDDTDQDSQP